MLSNVCKYVKPKPISRQNQKLTQQHNWKKVPPAHAQRVYLFLCLSFWLSVRAKRGIWSKRVFMRMIGNLSFSVRWRNTMIIHLFLLAKKVLDIFEKRLWLEGCRSIQCKKEIHSNRKFGSHYFWFDLIVSVKIRNLIRIFLN